MKQDDLKHYDVNNSELFERLNQSPDELDFNGLIDGEDIQPIDMDAIDEESSKDANNIIDNISELYSNKDFMDKNPKIKKRIETELESLRILLKMRKADEITHDILIKAISEHTSNASLYKAMTEVQKTILSVTTKITDVLTGLENILKNCQLELDFKENDSDEPAEENIDIHTHRGSREFINNMLSNDKEDS